MGTLSWNFSSLEKKDKIFGQSSDIELGGPSLKEGVPVCRSRGLDFNAIQGNSIEIMLAH